jgi:Ca2+-binding RTX toxin-like protein
MTGGRGNDTYYIDNVDDQIIGERWWDGDTTTVYTSIDFNQMTQADTVILTGSDDIDITTNFMNNTLVGNSGNNTIDGARGDDTISGGSGDDVLIGGHGADVMTGGRGNDTISGGSGDDIFIFKKKFGRDVISDFEESDVIDLSRVKKITSFEDLMANHLSQNGLDSVISAGKSKSITLVDVQVEELTADHFIF